MEPEVFETLAVHPFRLSQCCLVMDGGALIPGPADRACDFPQKSVSLLGAGDVVESASGVRRDKAALSSGCKSHPANAPAGSSRSSYGGDEVAEAFGMRVTNW